MNADDNGGDSSSLLRLPYQLLTDYILSELDVISLVRLREVSKSLQRAVDDELVWRRRIQADFRFPTNSSARTTGWKSLYRGLSDPEVYTWGMLDNDRLGANLPYRVHLNRPFTPPIFPPTWNVITRTQCMPFPLRITWNRADVYDATAKVVDGQPHRFERPLNYDYRGNIPFKSIEPRGRSSEHKVDMGVPVELHAGGWSFYALTHRGQVLAWGSAGGDNDTTETERTFKVPTMLDLRGKKAKSISAGRGHLIAHMDDESIWEWSNRWDRPAVHFTTSLLANSAGQIRQIDAGWDFTAMLVERGEKSNVVVWKTSWTNMTQRNQWFERAQAVGSSASASNEQIEPTWEVSVPSVTLPPLPERILRIAAGDHFVIALGESSVVYFIALPEHIREDSSDSPRTRAETLQQSMIRNYTQWTLLNAFSNFRKADPKAWKEANMEILVEGEVKVTHISAQFQSFAVYAPDAGKQRGSERVGAVLLGHKDRPNEATVVPELQGIGVIKVQHGDYHSGALTADGRVLTWGQQSQGALGTWDAVPVSENSLSLLSPTPTVHPPGFRAGASISARATGIFRNMLSMPQAETGQQQGQDSDDATGNTWEKSMGRAERQRYLVRRLPERFEKPEQVRFGYPRVGERRTGRIMTEEDTVETKSVFDIAFAGWHSGALAIDRLLLGG